MAEACLHQLHVAPAAEQAILIGAHGVRQPLTAEPPDPGTDRD